MKDNIKDEILEVTLDGKSMKNKKDLLVEFSRKLNFPDYFGNNWDALLDCLRDLAWIDQNEIKITLINKEYLLIDDPNHQEDIFYKFIKIINEYWIQDKSKKVDFIIP